jgi:D-lactate dehydrogenase
MPVAASALPSTDREGAAAVYFPACISRTLGPLPGEPADVSIAGALVAVARRAGAPVWIPPDIAGCCCGVPFSSKGYTEAHRLAVSQTIKRFWKWSDGGRLPIVVDTTPCTYGLRTCRPVLPQEMQAQFDRLIIVDGLEFVADTLLSRLEVRSRERRVVLHPVCSAVKLDLETRLARIGAACANESRIPPSAGCCGFAGDRGWLLPELTASATRAEADEARAADASGHYSSSRTCEVGMTRATGHVYRSYLHLVERATRESQRSGGSSA